jgi:hypothetical protein
MTLRAYCDGCGQQVKPLKAGYLEVNLTDVYRVERDVKAWEKDRGQETPLGKTYDGADLMAHPEAATWHVWHRTCDPDPDEERGQYYHFTLDRVGDAAGLLHWTSHLMEKNWLEHTNWRQLIGRAADGVGPLRCPGSKRAP